MPFDKDGVSVPMKDAYDAWQPFAIALLVDTAKTFNGFVTYKQLAQFVQDETGITHKGLITNWIGELLGRVIEHCLREEIPQLSSLCVTSDGTVGKGYLAAVTAVATGNDGPTGNTTVELSLDELDDHAAKARLECYRFFGAELPSGGGHPTLTPQAKTARDRKRAQAKRDEPPKLCPVHNLQLSARGTCYECD